MVAAVGLNTESQRSQAVTPSRPSGLRCWLLALGGAEAAAGVPFAGVFVRDSVGGCAANIVEPDPILA